MRGHLKWGIGFVCVLVLVGAARADVPPDWESIDNIDPPSWCDDPGDPVDPHWTWVFTMQDSSELVLPNGHRKLQSPFYYDASADRLYVYSGSDLRAALDAAVVSGKIGGKQHASILATLPHLDAPNGDSPGFLELGYWETVDPVSGATSLDPRNAPRVTEADYALWLLEHGLAKSTAPPVEGNQEFGIEPCFRGREVFFDRSVDLIDCCYVDPTGPGGDRVNPCVGDECGECGDPDECGPLETCPGGQVCDDGECSDCENHEDCPPGDVCIDGRCEPAPPCCPDGTCPEGLVCEAGNCQPCDGHGDCDAGQVCLGGSCVDPPPCDPDGECPAGLVCDGGICRPCAGHDDCDTGEVCIGGECKDEDCEDEDCTVDDRDECVIGYCEDEQCETAPNPDPPDPCLCWDYWVGSQQNNISTVIEYPLLGADAQILLGAQAQLLDATFELAQASQALSDWWGEGVGIEELPFFLAQAGAVIDQYSEALASFVNILDTADWTEAAQPTIQRLGGSITFEVKSLPEEVAHFDLSVGIELMRWYSTDSFAPHGQLWQGELNNIQDFPDGFGTYTVNVNGNYGKVRMKVRNHDCHPPVYEEYLQFDIGPREFEEDVADQMVAHWTTVEQQLNDQDSILSTIDFWVFFARQVLEAIPVLGDIIDAVLANQYHIAKNRAQAAVGGVRSTNCTQLIFNLNAAENNLPEYSGVPPGGSTTPIGESQNTPARANCVP